MPRRGRPTDKDLFLAPLPTDGSGIGNGTLRTRLGWDEDKYYRLREALLNEGLIAKGPGRGGSVCRVVLAPPVAEVAAADHQEPEGGDLTPAPVAATTTREADLYVPIRRVLETEWPRERGLDTAFVHVEITAAQGGRPTGGRWTRPDLTMLSMRAFALLPGKFLDVWTFEVKPADQCDVTGVFEAAAHSRCASRSYVMFHVPDPAGLDQVLSRCADEARRFGVGLVAFEDPANFDTWNVRVHAVRREPDPELLQEFLSTQVSDAGKDKLGRWKA